MKNLFAVFTITIFFTNILSAQSDYKTTWSAPVELGNDIWVNDIIYADSTGILLRTEEGTGLVYFNSQLKRQYAAPLEGWQKEEQDYIHFFFQLNNRLWVMYSNYNKADRDILYRCQEVDIPMHRVTGNVIDICSIKDTLSGVEGRLLWSDSKKDQINLRLIHDQLNSKIAFIFTLYPGSMNTYKVVVFNKKMRRIWEREIVLPFEDTELQVYKFALSASGDLFATADIFGPISDKINTPEAAIIDKKLKKTDFQSGLFEFPGAKDTFNLFHLDTDDKKMSQSSLYADGEGKIHVDGFYADNSFQKLNGRMEFIYDPILLKMEKKGPFPFSSGLLKKISPIDRKPLEYLPSGADDVICTRTDSFLQILVEYKDQNYMYDGVFIRANAQNAQNDGLRIDKKQYYGGDHRIDFVSYNYLVYPDKSIIIYNKEGKKEEKSIELVEWMNNGEIIRHHFQPPGKDADTMSAIPWASYRLEPDKCLILVATRDHKRFRIGVVSKD